MSKSIRFRAFLLLTILVAEFGALEGGLRLYSAFEGSRTFQSLFMDDPAVGIRLRPGANIRYTTVEFSTDITINAQGVRDSDPIGPKPSGERRILVLGDSLVLSVQVSLAETFCKRLESRLNATSGPTHWRVINGGVQGYGPVDEWLFYEHVAAAFQPDIVLIVTFVGNDATEAADLGSWVEAGKPIRVDQPGVRWFRRIVRSSIVLQMVRVRWDQLRSRFEYGTPEPPLATYLASPPPAVARGLEVTREVYGRIAARAKADGAQTAVALMPARFQVNDEDFGNYDHLIREMGAQLDRNAGSRRFAEALAPLGLPMIDLLPVLTSQPNPKGVFFQRTVHLTPRGHDEVASALFDFFKRSGLVH